MASLVSESFKDVVSIKIKERIDDITDQYTRIFIVKILILSTLVTSLGECENYVPSVCWIQGLYIYHDAYGNIDDYHAYGMPREPTKDGITPTDNHLCEVGGKQSGVDCIPLNRMYFNQYQYMPFYIASLAVYYYLPYVLYRLVNSDVIALKDEILITSQDDEAIEKCAAHIVNTYFRYFQNGGVFELRIRVVAGTLVKLVYFMVNCTGFWFTDRILNYRFTNYGIEWIKWSRLNNTVAYQFTHPSNTGPLNPRPGDYLLPSLGFCDVAEGYHDNLDAHNNKYQTICELSQHIIYQYIFLVLWFVLLIGMVVSLASFTSKIFSLLLANARALLSNIKGSGFKKRNNSALFSDYEGLTMRETQYMKLIRRRNDILHEEVLHQLRHKK